MCTSSRITVQEEGKSNEVPTPFEEALILTGKGRFHTWLLLVCGLCLCSVMLQVFATSFLLPSAQCDFQLSSADKGLLSAICNIGMVCSSHLWGFLADTKGRRNIIILTLLLDCLCTVIESFAHAFWLFVFLRFLNGFFIVGPAAVTYAYLGEFHSSRTRGSAVMWVCIFIGIGVCVQPGLAWLVIPRPWSFTLPWCVYKSWRIFVFLCSLPGLLTALCLLFTLPESPKFLMAQGDKEGALKILKKMYASNTGNSPDRFPVKSLILVEESVLLTSARSKNPIMQVFQHMWVQTKPLFMPPFLFKTLLACVIQYGLYASANGLNLWIPDIFNRLAEHGALHNNTPCTMCEAYRVPTFQENVFLNAITDQNITTYNELNLTDVGQTKPMLHQDMESDSVYLFLCSNDFSAQFVNEKFSLYCNNNSIDLTCKNTSVTLTFDSDIQVLNTNDNLNSISLNLNGNNKSLTNYFMKTNWSAMTIYLCNGSKVMCRSEDRHQEEIAPGCSGNVDISAFQNALILGAAGALSYVIVGNLIDRVGKKTILVFSLGVGGIAGACMNFVYTQVELMLLMGMFVVLSGMCISVVISVVIDIFPTHLRAMATCLSLMVGRLGSVTVNIMLGALMETNCQMMIYILGGICFSCGLFSLLIPSAKKNSLT